MPEKTGGRRTGFEISREFEAERRTIWERMQVDKEELKSGIYSLIPLFLVLLVGCWLASNPLENTVRLPDSPYNQAHGLVGTNEWHIVWHVVLIGLFFEFMDASAGMGFGTAMSPLLMMIGFTPLQVVPVIMIQQGTAGAIGAFLHKEFKNVEWRFKPMSETVKLWLFIAGMGCLATLISITAVYSIFKVHKIWIKTYVLLLLLAMGLIALYQGFSTREWSYKPKLMLLFGFLAGFNKGIGGGGYGPVVTVGGLLSGVPAKSQLAVTAISEGTVSLFAVIVWFANLGAGIKIDFLLLPSTMITVIGGGILAPFAVRVFPEKLWRWVVPIYAILLTVYGFYQIGPQLLAALGMK